MAPFMLHSNLHSSITFLSSFMDKKAPKAAVTDSRYYKFLQKMLIVEHS